jgi:hypothetical protein
MFNVAYYLIMNPLLALNISLLAFEVFLCIGGFIGFHVTFGHGLGDLLYFAFLCLLTITHLVWIIKIWKTDPKRFITPLITFSITTILFCFKATIWRGHEYPWNGRFFYLPCSTKITVENPDEKEEMLIQMCSMDYDSNFRGIWDGQKMTIKDGQIQIPANLEKFIKRPILKVEIEPEFWEKLENDDLIKEYQFNKDTLKMNEVYHLQGEIVAIRNNSPVMQVIIKNSR